MTIDISIIDLRSHWGGRTDILVPRAVLWPFASSFQAVLVPAESIFPWIPWLQNGLCMTTLNCMTKLQTTTVQETDEELATSACLRTNDTELERAKASFSLLYARHSRLLRAFLSSRIHRSELDDIEQGIWERIWQRMPDQFKGGNFRAWLHQIARNYIVDFYRKNRQSELPESFDASDPAAITPDSVIIEREGMDRLERCLGRLTDPMATVVRGRLKGESYEALCEELGIDNARAQKLLFTAKQLLQSCVEGGAK